MHRWTSRRSREQGPAGSGDIGSTEQRLAWMATGVIGVFAATGGRGSGATQGLVTLVGTRAALPGRALTSACSPLQAVAGAAEGRRAAEWRAADLAQRLAAADAVSAQLAAAAAAVATGAELAAKARAARGGSRVAAARWTLL